MVYLSWDQGRYDKDMKHDHQNSIPWANFNSRLSTNKSHQLFRGWHCLTPDVVFIQIYFLIRYSLHFLLNVSEKLYCTVI